MPQTVAPTEPGPDEHAVSLQEALEIAVTAHRSGDVETAEHVYGRLLEAAPDWAPALHFYGLFHHHRGKPDEALHLIGRAISIAGDPGMYNNLGNILSELGRPAEAADAYEASLRLYPDHSDALSNRGVALRALGRLDEAEACYRRAIEVDPKHREAYDNLGGLLSGLGRVQEAIVCHTRAMELQPRNADTRRLLAAAYTAIGEFDKALDILQAWLDQEPNSPTARHLYAAISGRNVPERAEDAFVETTFDRFAATFDAKLAKLDYRAPEIVGAAVARAAGEARGDLSVLDAGCGTGLCGPFLRPYASRLVGVDLSSKMLDGARARGGYDDLVHAELTAFLQAAPGAFDILVSADTLCYFGPLEAVLAAAAEALRPGGLLAFTVEEEDGPDEVRLNPHGRYSHRPDYVGRVLADAGLAQVGIARDTLRKERGVPVPGLVVTARKPRPN